MISQVTQFFSRCMLLSIDAEPQSRAHAIQLTTAALLIEVSRADFNADDSEQSYIVELLRNQFELSSEELDRLINLGQQEADQATSLYQFTRLINDNYSPEQKSLLIQSLWQVALADDYLDKHEDHLIRKVADLIHVSHKEFIRIKLAVIEQRKN